MAEEKELTGFSKYLKEQNIEISFNRIAIQALGGMAHGLFASLLIGTIFGMVARFLPEPNVLGDFLRGVIKYTGPISGAAMAIAIGYSVKAAPFIIYSLATVGMATNALGGAGGPLAVFVVSLIAIFFGKLVSKRTPVDLIVTPTVTILVGVFAATIIAPPIGAAAKQLGVLIMWATEQQPFIMGILVSVIVGIVLTLPISSAAICAALGLVGLAGGAAVAGCCAHMVGFAVASYRENKLEGLSSIGIGTSMLLVPNLMRKPILWAPAVIASAITGPIATCIFKMTQNSAAVNSGMGTCGLVGPIGVVSGWYGPSEKALELGQAAMDPTGFDWLGMILVCIVLPAIIAFIVSEFMRKSGMIKDGDYKLV